MTGTRTALRLRWLWLTWALFWSGHIAAMSIAEPEPLAIAFQAGADRPTRDGLLALDRLAVRAAQCPTDGLAVHLEVARTADASLAQRRMAAVRQHMMNLGLRLSVEMKPLRTTQDEQGVRAHRDVWLADVGAGDDVWCYARKASHVYGWAQELARHIEGATAVAPAFWRLLAAPARQELVRPLAAAAYCQPSPDCRPHPALYRWLAEQTLDGVSVDVRREWLLDLWLHADDSEVEDFRRRWALAPLTAKERASQAEEMASSDLSWALIEQRLLAPEVMKRFGDRPMIAGGPGPHGLLAIASRRGRLDAFDRLIDAAGPAKACFVDGAFRMAVFADEFDSLKPHFSSWARGIAVAYQPPGAYESCNPAAAVLVSAYCGRERDEDAVRYEEIWKTLQQAGISMDSPAIRPLMSTSGAIYPWQCRLEPVPGSVTRFRPVARP